VSPQCRTFEKQYELVVHLTSAVLAALHPYITNDDGIFPIVDKVLAALGISQ